VHHPERVFETRMHRTWIDLICPGKLAYPPQALKGRLRKYGHFPVVGMHEAVDGTSNLVDFVRVQLQNNFRRSRPSSIGEQKEKYKGIVSGGFSGLPLAGSPTIGTQEGP
jgi:hypothetical protein